MNLAAERYNRGARALHWAIAVLVIANLASGLLHESLEGVIRLIPLHKATGMTVLALTILRILWRFTWRAPPYPPAMSGWQITLARIVQGGFYALMVIMPVSGWIMASAGKYPLSWFGLFDLPKLAVTRDGLVYLAGRNAHEVLGWLFLAMVVLHVAAALRHHFVLKDEVLRRMA
jgi:cytochrome b561